jgi:hypothetical protein
MFPDVSYGRPGENMTCPLVLVKAGRQSLIVSLQVTTPEDGGWPALCFSFQVTTKEGAPSFPGFGKGGRPRKLALFLLLSLLLRELGAGRLG